MEGVRRDRMEDGLRSGQRTDRKRGSQWRREMNRELQADREIGREGGTQADREMGQRPDWSERDSEGEGNEATETVRWERGSGGSMNRKVMEQNRDRTHGGWGRR